jgi:hypothetical protein
MGLVNYNNIVLYVHVDGYIYDIYYEIRMFIYCIC